MSLKELKEQLLDSAMGINSGDITLPHKATEVFLHSANGKFGKTSNTLASSITARRVPPKSHQSVATEEVLLDIRQAIWDINSKLNCEVLQDSLAFEVRWAVAGDSIVVQLVGKLDGEQYMSFGLSTSPERSLMIGGDVVVAWVDKRTLQGYAVDYFLDAKSQCSGGRGSCPDTRIQNNTNSVRLLNAAMVNGYSIVTYQRPLEASDELDRQIRTNGSQAIIWAVGPLNERQEVSFHSHYLKTDKSIEFGRPPSWNCPVPDDDTPHSHVDNIEKEKKQEFVATTRRPQRLVPTPASATTKDAWVIPPIQCDEPEDGVFFAQMGPTGGKHGYPAITGHVGWGISWYINGLLIPEINVVRGKKYTFVVEGGEDPEIPARYHPFYITDDPVGGYQHKTPEEKAEVNIFAGVRRQRGTVRPTGMGRLCKWLPDQNLPSADDFESFGAYQRTLTLKCDPGEPGFVEWTPDENTPDIVYYQCFTHRYLGWKINVLDSCNKSQGAATETQEVYIQPGQVQKKQESDLKISSNIGVTSKVAPDPNFYHHHHPHTHYTAVPNKKFSMNFTGKLILTNSHNNNNKLIPTGVLGDGEMEVGYEQHWDPYRMMMQSYEEHDQSFLVISPPSQSTKYMHQNQYHYHRHHHPPRVHENVGMKTQGHMEVNPLTLMKHHHRAPSVQNIHLGAYYQEIPGEKGKGFPDGQLYAAAGASNSASGNSINLNQHLANLDQAVHQSAPMTIGIIASPNQLCNLIPDKQPIMSYGKTKFAYSNPGFAQYIYSRLSQSQPHTTSRLMTLRRPMIQPPVQIQPERQPILGSIIISNGGKELAPRPQPFFVGRQKITYPRSSHIIVRTSGQQKLAKLKNKLQSKIETKMSSEADVQFVDQRLGRASIIKSMRITGFEPHSIIVEGGFMPIIRHATRESTIRMNQQFSRNLKSSPVDAAADTKNKPAEQLEDKNSVTMFVPSSLVRNMAKPQENMIIRVQPIEANMRLNEFDDIEMAADRLNSYYLPPSDSSISSTKVGDRISSSALITFDGRRVNDSSLTRSIPRTEVKRSRSSLTSDALSRTPQFGRFKGELPPPIPVNVKIENIPQLELRGVQRTDFEVPQSDRATTKHTPFERARRSTQLQKVDETIDISEKTNVSRFYEHTDYNDHDSATTTLSSTGQMFITNIQYIFLTIVLYFAI